LLVYPRQVRRALMACSMPMFMLAIMTSSDVCEVSEAG
jgi:hypothetical protein